MTSAVTLFSSCDSDGEESAYNARDLGLISGLGRSSGEGNGYPLQYSCLESSMDGGAWQGTVHSVTKSWTWLRDNTFTLYSQIMSHSQALRSGTQAYEFGKEYSSTHNW